jgi:16S rRNA (uracil1498-N3)-methyltransferase
LNYLGRAAEEAGSDAGQGNDGATGSDAGAQASDAAAHGSDAANGNDAAQANDAAAHGAHAAPLRLLLEPVAESWAPPEMRLSAVEIAIGPEGGFADAELEALRLAGFLKVRLGPRTLRTETAALAGLTWLQTRFGDMSGF